MDLSFSGLSTAATEAAKKHDLADVCYSLQETAFAMCVEVTERAMSLAGKSEVLLVGGVGANRRLQEMLRIMCEERGARFFVPEQRYLGDNGAMIAYTGRLMLESGVTLPVERSLAHADSNLVRGTYNRGRYWDERVAMHQWRSDYLDQLRLGGKVVPFPAPDWTKKKPKEHLRVI